MAGLSNKHLSGVLKEIEILLKLTGESDQRAMNYGRLSRMIEGLGESAADLAAQGTLKDIQGLGPRVQTIVAELVDTGTSTMRDDLAGQLAPGVIEILRVPGLGPKRIHTVVNELRVSSIEELVEAASDGRLAGLKGFGQKTATNVLEGPTASISSVHDSSSTTGCSRPTRTAGLVSRRTSTITRSCSTRRSNCCRRAGTPSTCNSHAGSPTVCWRTSRMEHTAAFISRRAVTRP